MCLVVWLPKDPLAKGWGRQEMEEKEGRGRGLSGESDRDETITG